MEVVAGCSHRYTLLEPQLHHQVRFSCCVRLGNGLQPTDRAILQQDVPRWQSRGHGRGGRWEENA